MRPGVTPHYISPLLPFQHGTNNILDTALTDHDINTSSGISKDGKLIWLIRGPVIEILSSVTRQCIASWVFGVSLKDTHSYITCVEEYCYGNQGNKRKLLVGVCNALQSSMVCVLDIHTSRVTKVIEIPHKVSSIETVTRVGGDYIPLWALNDQLRLFHGIIAVGTISGIVYLIGPNERKYFDNGPGVFELTDFNKKHKSISFKPFNFACTLKLSKAQLQEKAFKDGIIDQLYELFMDHFNIHSHKIGFPELALPAIIQLKEFLKKCKIANYCKQIKQILDKVQETTKFITDRRKTVSFSISDDKAITAWEHDCKNAGTPITKYFKTWRKLRDRQLQYQIAAKEQGLSKAEEEIPVIERPKGVQKASAAEKEEFSALFDTDSEESDDEERFLLKTERTEKKKTKDESDDENYSDFGSDDLEQLAKSASEDEEDDDDDEVQDDDDDDEVQDDDDDDEVQDDDSDEVQDQTDDDDDESDIDDNMADKEDVVEDFTMSDSD